MKKTTNRRSKHCTFFDLHWAKSVQIRGFSGPYFPVFGLNMGKYGPEKLCIWAIFTQFWRNLEQEIKCILKILIKASSDNKC